MKWFWNILAVPVFGAMIVGQLWIFWIMYQAIGWPVFVLILGVVVAGWLWRPPKNHPPVPFYDDNPDVG
jgi:hypothetical protein